MQKEIFDCHCHFVNKEDFELYKKTATATKFLNIRSINNPNLTKPYNFDTFKDEINMYFTESVDLYNLEEELMRVEENLKRNERIVAIKIYLGYQLFYANDAKIVEVTKLAEKYGVSMVFHCGETYVPNGENDSSNTYSNAKYIEDLAKQFKNVNFVGSHFNFPDFDDIFDLCNKYENVYTCISGCLDAIDKEKRYKQVAYAVEVLNKYIKKYPVLTTKIMYGTDFFSEDLGFIDVSDYIKIVNSLKLNETEKEQILCTNILSAYKKLAQ